MSKIPFYIGNFLAMFTPGGARRAYVRGHVNTLLYTPRIKALIKRVYNEKVTKIVFERQINLNRFVCVANDKYYVKVFRNISLQRLQEHKFLVDLVRPHLSVTVPDMHIDEHVPMYVSKKIDGRRADRFDGAFILKNEEKLKEQVAKVIKEIQSIDIDSIPDNQRFLYGLQPERQKEKELAPGKKVKPVLAHFDLNESNLFCDEEMNITGVIDWDTLSIAKNPDTDMNVFMLFWTRFRKYLLKKLKMN